MHPSPEAPLAAPFAQDPTWTGTPPRGTRAGGTRAIGNDTVVVILIQFSDVAASTSSAQVDTLVNDASPGAGSVRNYYREVSYGLFNLAGTVTPWFTTPNPLSEYGADSSASSFDDANGPVYRLVVEAVQRADAAVDFSAFDGDGDGVVDHVVVVHAGGAQEETGRASDIWSHRWSVADANPGVPGNQALRADGVQIFGYILVSEDSPVGVYVHELGHDLGLPDLYDTDGSSDGVGKWDVMGSGSWNGPINGKGTVPAHFGAWGKIELGWIAPIEVVRPLPGQAIDAAETNRQAFRLPIGSATGGEEYFLVENRQRTGFDADLPGDGLLIWHVDEAVPGNANDDHRKVDLEEADGDDRPTEAADAWADRVEGWGPDTTPNSNSYLNQRTGWKVRNIGASGAAMVADLSREVLDDLVILDIQRPCCAATGDTVPVTVEVGNRGARTQANAAVNLTVYRDAYVPTAVVCCSGRTVPSLAQGDTRNLTWDVPAAAAGKYILEASVTLAADEIPENNYRFAHFSAAAHYFFDDVEAGTNGWTRNGLPTDPAGWGIVQDSNASVSHSPTHAWWFGPNPGGLPCLPTCPDFHTLTSRNVSVPGGPAYLYFWHRYDLRGRTEVNGTVETDTAYVNVTVDGVREVSDMLLGAQEEWTAFQVNLTQWVSGPAMIAVEFSASSAYVQTGGGWWVDDVAVTNAPLTPGLVTRAVTPTVVVEPGGVAIFRFKLANVGDFEDNVTFALQPPAGWTALVGVNQTRMTAFDQYETRLRPDADATLLLGFLVAADAQRGARITVPVTAVSERDVAASSTFEVTAVINDPFGLAGLEKYIFLFLVVFAIIIVIAVVIDATKKQRGVYRRW
jgi:immune inhibitor A